MAANPTDILNEVLAASNKIAASQLDSSRTLNEVQEKVSARSKKLSRTIRNTIDQLGLFTQEQKQKKEEKKKDSSILWFIKNTTTLLEKATKKKSVKELVKKETPRENQFDKVKNTTTLLEKATKKKSVKELVKKETPRENQFDKVTITNSNLVVRGNLFVNSKSFRIPLDLDKTKESQEDFYRTDDVNYLNEELSLLKSIERKLNFSGGEAGLFDGLFGGISNLIKMFTGASTAGVGGMLGGMFGLTKFKKLGNILKPLSKLKTKMGSLKDSAKLLKNPKMLIPLVVAAAGYTIYDSAKAGVFTKPLDEIGNAEQRQNGGKVFSGKPYIVGEKGPELFTPRETGRIIPNNKLQSHGDKYRSEESGLNQILDLVHEQNKLSSKTFDFFTNSFDKVLEFFRPSNLLELIKKGVKGLIGNVKDKIGAGVTLIKNTTANIVNTASDIGNRGLGILGLNNIFQFGKMDVEKQEPAPPARRIGDKNVPRDMRVTLHKNEMVIPAEPSETLRAVAKLQNQNLRTPQMPQYVRKQQLGKEFWMDEFVPKFASMISTKPADDRLKSYSVGNIFGVP